MVSRLWRTFLELVGLDTGHGIYDRSRRRLKEPRPRPHHQLTMFTMRTAACVLLAGMLAHAAPVPEGIPRSNMFPRDDDTPTPEWKDMTPGQRKGTIVLYVFFGLIGCGILAIFCAIAVSRWQERR